MDAEKFINKLLDESEKDYGICPPPLKAQDGLDILFKHFLGDDWYVTLPLSVEQINAEAIYTILRLYPKKEKFSDKIKNFFTEITKL